MKILIADKLVPEGAQYLSSRPDFEVDTVTGLAGDDLAGALRDHDGVVIRSAVKITDRVLETCMSDRGSRLRAIARAGVGVDNIDLAAATRHGIAVMNSASASTITTAEHAFAMMIGLARNIGHAHADMTRGGWNRSTFMGTQLHGKTLGVVGFGRIGQTLARRALDFGMEVVGFDPVINAETGLEGRVPLVGSFDELIERVDIVSFHVPKTASTTGMLSAPQFAMARPGLLVVNAARGGVVNETDLLAAIESGRCGGAALDVFEAEPLPDDSPLRGHPKIMLTPHLGASTLEAQEAVAVDACRAIADYLEGRALVGAVNAGNLQLDLNERQQSFVGLAASMVALLAAASDRPGMGRVRVTVRGETLAGRADTIARYALAEMLNRHLDQPVNVINAGVIADERGIEAETVIAADHGEDRLAIEIHDRGDVRRVEGAVYGDGRPRVTHLDGYALDMVAEGHMVLLRNVDEPGRIGLVGGHFGDAGVNIAEMVIGRRSASEGEPATAMMILKLDEAPTGALIDSLAALPGILKVAAVELTT